MESLSVLDRLFQQIQEGWDIPTPPGLLRVKQEQAAITLPGMPYSMIKNLAHAVFWQELWLGALSGEPKRPSMEIWKGDWREPDPGEWQGLRKRFVEGLQKAREYCKPENLKPENLKPSLTPEKAIDTLLAIAVHASYHMGQLNLLKRGLKGLK